MIAQFLVVVGAVLIVCGVIVSIRQRSRKPAAEVEEVSDGAPRGLMLLYEEDDLRSAPPAGDPDEEDPFLRALRSDAPIAPPETAAVPQPEPLVVNTAVAVLDEPPQQQFTIPVLQDVDEGPVDFSGFGAIDDAERQRLLAELEATLKTTATVVESEPAPPVEAVREEPKHVVEAAGDAQPGIVETFHWPTFIGPEAQSLGIAEREILVVMMRGLHEPSWCVPTLLAAFYEEEADGLRPRVLEALVHSYNGEHLAPVFEYCLEHGTEEERALAQRGQEQIRETE